MALPRSLKVAVVGITGAVGKEMLKILEQRHFPVKELVGFASENSRGKPIVWKDRTVLCRVLEPGCFQGVDIAFFDASDEVSKKWALKATEEGAWVIDNSATYRMDKDVPLVVPEVNAKRFLKKWKNAKNPKHKIIAGPNCSTVQLVMALEVLRKNFGLKRVIVSSYQSVSGAGISAIEEMKTQTRAYLEGRSEAPEIFQHQIAFNTIPQIGGFKENGYTSEELKIIQETKKILNLPKLKVAATAVRVPTFLGHGESVMVELSKDFTIPQLKKKFSQFAGVELIDDPENKLYPMPNPGPLSKVTGAAGKDPVYVGRLRKDLDHNKVLHFWIVSDNLRKGAALNAIQIGEALIKVLA